MFSMRGIALEIELEMLQLPDMPQVVYKNPPLALAICQVRYNSILNVANVGFVAPFQNAIQSLYPQVTTIPSQEIQFNIAPSEFGIHQGNPSIQWQFSDVDDNWRIVLASNYFSIETRTYKHFDVFIDRLKGALDALVKYIKPTAVLRIGLRYINEIRSVDIHWSDIIRHELLGPLVSPKLISNATQASAFQQMQLHFSDNQGISINHGLLSSGSAVRPRGGTQSLEQPFYLLDFDVYREFPAPKVLLMDPDSICRHVNKYHRAISQLFYWSVTEKYLSTLEVEQHVSN